MTDMMEARAPGLRRVLRYLGPYSPWGTTAASFLAACVALFVSAVAAPPLILLVLWWWRLWLS